MIYRFCDLGWGEWMCGYADIEKRSENPHHFSKYKEFVDHSIKVESGQWDESKKSVFGNVASEAEQRRT
jgi:hypothetical protein